MATISSSSSSSSSLVLESMGEDHPLSHPLMLTASAGICQDLETQISITYKKEEGLNNSDGQGTRQLSYYETTTYMVPELYRSATTGNIKDFKRAIEDTESSALDQKSPRRNTVLHIAASLGHDKLVEFILQQFPDQDLVNSLNYQGELALHLAATYGHLPTVKTLVHFFNSKEVKIVLERVNREGKTALQIALENQHQEVAEFLAEADPTAPHYQNCGKNSPLYMAAVAGYRELVKLLIMDKEANGSNSRSESVVDPCEEHKFYNKKYCEGKTLLHAAIMAKNRDVLDKIWGSDPTLMDSIDEEGRTPLSFAAYIGYLEGVKYLLEKSTDGAYQRDGSGAFPIHSAASKGHIKIVQEFLKRCPDSRELLDMKGRNILHVAAMHGKAKAVSYMLKKPELKTLINERDNEDNTPLHLATQKWHPKVVSILTWEKRVRLELVAKNGLTARDVAEKNLEMPAPYQQLLTLIALKSANAPRSEHWNAIRTKPKSYSSLQPHSKKHCREPSEEHYRERVNTLLLVATLVATVTFAAGFTLPGGNNDSEPDKGMATLITKPTFQAFLIFNTIAMYSSIIVVITLIFAQVADLNLVLTALNLALPFLGVAVTMMSLAFMVGTYLVVSNLNWLAIVVFTMGLIFLIILFVLFFPLYSPISSNHCIARYLLYYAFCLMIWASRSDIESRKD